MSQSHSKSSPQFTSQEMTTHLADAVSHPGEELSHSSINNPGMLVTSQFAVDKTNHYIVFIFLSVQQMVCTI